MNRLRRANSPKLFIRFLIPYIIILLTPILLGYVLYEKTLQVMEANSKENNIAILEQCVEVLEQRFNEIEMIVQQQLVNKDVQSFLSREEPFGSQNFYSILETRKHLYNYRTLNNFILDYFVFFNRSELVMSHEITYSYRQFYDMILRYNDLSYEDWRTQIKENFYQKAFWPSMPVSYYKQNYLVITYIQSIGYSKTSNGCIMILIDNNRIQKLLDKLNTGEGGWWYIIDREGRIISGISPDNPNFEPIGINFEDTGGIMRMPVNDKEMLVSYVSSSKLGWKFVAVQPLSIVMEKVEYVKSITLSVVAAILLLGIIMAYLLAYRNARPIREIINGIVKNNVD